MKKKHANKNKAQLGEIKWLENDEKKKQNR